MRLRDLNCLHKIPPGVLAAGVLAGGVMIAFPAATIAAVVGTLAMLGLIGLVALVVVAAVALLPPILTALALLTVVAGVRSALRFASRASAAGILSAGANNLHVWHPLRTLEDNASLRLVGASAAAGEALVNSGPACEALDEWNNDGGSAAPAAAPEWARARVTRRRTYSVIRRRRLAVAAVRASAERGRGRRQLQ